MMRGLAARFGVRLSGMLIHSLAQGEGRVLARQRVELIRMQSNAIRRKTFKNRTG